MSSYPAAGRRIIVIGTSGSGKTTMARKIAERLGFPHTELDSLHWEADWVEAPLDRFQRRATEATTGPCWVLDGNYNKVREITWAAADTLVWLDYPLPLILWRLLGRTLHRVFAREELWSGNRERLVTQFFSRESLFLWAIGSHRRHRTQYPALFQRPEYRHLAVIHLRSPGDAAQWFEAL